MIDRNPGSAVVMAKVLLRKFPGIPWIDIADIRKGPRVGVGASAEVYGGLWQGTPVAVKVQPSMHCSVCYANKLIDRVIDVVCSDYMPIDRNHSKTFSERLRS
jgi:hypothetical protein